MKKVLVIGYSQTGQLHEILKNISSNIENVEVDFIKVQPKNKYPFPWDSFTFFSQMPKSVSGEIIELEDFNFKHEKYDLIIFGYQIWYLSPSVPSNSILQHPKFEKIAQNTDFITVIGARNMWIMSQEKVKKRLQDINANLIGNIALVDNTSNMISVLTITYWLLQGKKNKRWGILPKPGIQEKDIENAKHFATPINKYFADSSFDLQSNFLRLGGTKVKVTLMFTESRAVIIFKKWAQIINKKATSPKKLKKWLFLFKIYLQIAIFVLSPIVLTVFSLFRLFIFGKLNKQKRYYQGITLK